jgi:hypothetical protein
MVEAIVCSQDWLRRATPINVEENYEELAELEKGRINKSYLFLCIFILHTCTNDVHCAHSFLMPFCVNFRVD